MWGLCLLVLYIVECMSVHWAFQQLESENLVSKDVEGPGPSGITAASAIAIIGRSLMYYTANENITSPSYRWSYSACSLTSDTHAHAQNQNVLLLCTHTLNHRVLWRCGTRQWQMPWPLWRVSSCWTSMVSLTGRPYVRYHNILLMEIPHPLIQYITYIVTGGTTLPHTIHNVLLMEIPHPLIWHIVYHWKYNVPYYLLGRGSNEVQHVVGMCSRDNNEVQNMWCVSLVPRVLQHVVCMCSGYSNEVHQVVCMSPAGPVCHCNCLWPMNCTLCTESCIH